MVRGLAQDFDIQDPGHVRLLRKFLHLGAIHYRDFQNDIAGKKSSRKIRNEIRSIQKAADKLDTKLASLSDSASEFLWWAQRNLRIRPFENEFVDLDDDKNEKTPIGHTIIRYRNEPNTETVSFLKERQILEAIKILRNLAQYALAQRKKSGHPLDLGLWTWVFNAQYFWEVTLGRPFTYSAYGNIKKSRAYEFCWAALTPLDPNLRPAALLTAMRKVIGSGHFDAQGRRNPSPRNNRAQN